MTVKGSFVSQVFAERSRGADGLAVLAFQEIKRSGERGEGSDHGDRPALSSLSSSSKLADLPTLVSPTSL